MGSSVVRRYVHKLDRRIEDCTPQKCTKQRIALLRMLKHVFVLIKFIVSEYDPFRFSLSLSASFWMFF